MPPLAGTHIAQKRLMQTHLRGLAPPPHPYVNAGRLIPNDALSGIKPGGYDFMKQSRFLLENSAEIFGCGGFDLWGCSPHARGNMGCCIPNCASRRRKKATKRKYFAPSSHKKYAQVLCPKGHHLELNALRLRGGMGAAQAPISDAPLRMCVSLARSAQWEWPCHCRGVGAASAPTSKNLYAIF